MSESKLVIRLSRRNGTVKKYYGRIRSLSLCNLVSYKHVTSPRVFYRGTVKCRGIQDNYFEVVATCKKE